MTVAPLTAGVLAGGHANHAGYYGPALRSELLRGLRGRAVQVAVTAPRDNPWDSRGAEPPGV